MSLRPPQEYVEEFSALEDEASRRESLRENPDWANAKLVAELCQKTKAMIGASPEKARSLAETTAWLARELDDRPGFALATRMIANTCHFSGLTEQAQEHYEAALDLYYDLGDERQAAITRSSSLVNLAYLGEYDLVFEWEKEARAVFEDLGDALRLAILEHNVANILYRQDRWEEALERYRYAYEQFLTLERPHDVAICLRNIAVCQISLHHFEDALNSYRKSRAYGKEHGLAHHVLQVDYNIAYLYYQRGEYTRSIGLFRAARRDCVEVGDQYHRALCDLDQSEIYLELNLVEDAAKLAHSAFNGFVEQKMHYEAGKALTFQALAFSRQGKSGESLEMLEKAREIFLDEENQLWPALIDFYRAVVLSRIQLPEDAISLAVAAAEEFDETSSSRAAMCELLLAELYLQIGQLGPAQDICYKALVRLSDLELPALEHQAYLLLGRIEEARGDRKTALEAYRQSHHWLEKLSSQLQGEDLKIAFLKDKHAVYESLFRLILEDPPGLARNEAAFDYVEQAKSRSLADLMAFRAHALRPRSDQTKQADQYRSLREELNFFYRQIDQRGLSGERPSIDDVRRIRRDARRKEQELLHALRELQVTDQDFSSLQSGMVMDLPTLRGSLPAQTAIIEYFIARGTIYVCVLDAERLEVIELADAKRIRRLHRSLQFQLGKMRPGPVFSAELEPLIRQATKAHLQDLYRELIEPIRALLQVDHLVFVPHGFLHYVPFHALEDEESALVDRYSISYAPSAGVFHLCATKTASCESRSLVLGIADEFAPQIEEEARTVASALPDAALLLGEEASEEALQEQAPGCRFVHIATHGLFRRDNPMFSAIQLGTSRLHLFDLYELRLDAEMVVLSGCGTGLSAVLGVDELVGLSRGLLYAGAQSVLVTLWDVHDISTAELMRHLYHRLRETSDRALALRRAMQDLREKYPHPYYWAPFILIGNPGGEA